MTLKQIWVAQCDLCGRLEHAKNVPGRYNNTDYIVPDGWDRGQNKDFVLCPECLSVIRRNKQ